MSKFCPVLNHNVVYLVCQECDDKVCMHSNSEPEIATEEPFYCIVAGSRTFKDYNFLKNKLDIILSKQKDVVIISGHANGADKLGERYAKERGYKIELFPADWSFGNSGGYIRNRQMHKFASEHSKRGCVCFWDGKSRGTAQNFKLAKEFNNELKIIRY